IPILEKLEFKKFLDQINDLQEKLGGKVLENQVSEVIETDDDIWFFGAEDTAKNKKQTNTNIQPRIIDTEAKLMELVEILRQFTNPEIPVAWDTETTALEPRDADLVGIGC
ncbi:MAG: DNA polymerase I, partial [Dolichospermum sp.]